MRTLTILFSLPLLAALLPGCGKPEQPAAARDAGAPVRAQIETVKSAAINETYEAVGTVQSLTVSELATRLAGNVLSVSVRPGDQVRAGQLLLQISDADIAAQVARAKAGQAEAEQSLQESEWAIKAAQSARDAADASKALATATWQRLSALLEKKSASRQEFEEAEAKYKTALAEADRAAQMCEAAQSRRKQALSRIEQAKAGVANAESQLPYARIASPIAGIVTMKNVDAGSYVSPGMPLLRVEDNRHYRAEVGVEESQLRHVAIGDAVRVAVAAAGDAPLPAKVAEIVPASDPRNRSFLIKLDLPPSPALRSGMFARALFVVGQRKAITLPPAAIIARGQLLIVYVVDAQNAARIRLVKTGRAFDERVEILSGLSEGERVVVGRTDLVRDGARIEAE